MPTNENAEELSEAIVGESKAGGSRARASSSPANLKQQAPLRKRKQTNEQQALAARWNQMSFSLSNGAQSLDAQSMFTQRVDEDDTPRTQETSKKPPKWPKVIVYGLSPAAVAHAMNETNCGEFELISKNRNLLHIIPLSEIAHTQALAICERLRADHFSNAKAEERVKGFVVKGLHGCFEDEEVSVAIGQFPIGNEH